MSTTAGAAKAKGSVRGPVLEVLRELLAGGHSDEVIALVATLVARNRELELLLAKLRESKNRGERVPREQLDLFLTMLHASSEGERGESEQVEADRALEQAAEEHGGRPELTKPPKQPAVRRPPPTGARRVLNPLPVPAEERPCPACGAERVCVAHETTEVIDLIPAEVIVRLDRRETLACATCEGEAVRAPMGDKVVVGGAYGARLVADLVVGKYWDGLPLNRQGQQLERLGLSIPSSSMADQITWATDLLRPIRGHLLASVLGADVMHLDGTGLPVRDKESPKGIVLGTLWGYVGDRASAAYLYTSTGKQLGQRPGEVGPLEFLARRKGFVVADASNLFDATFSGVSPCHRACHEFGRRGADFQGRF